MDTFLYVLIYVDDLIIAGNFPSVIFRFKLYLSTYFDMKDFGSLKYFLGIGIAPKCFWTLFHPIFTITRLELAYFEYLLSQFM